MSALKLEGNLLGSLGLLSEDGLGLATETLLLGVVAALTLSGGGVTALLVLGHFVVLVAATTLLDSATAASGPLSHLLRTTSRTPGDWVRGRKLLHKGTLDLPAVKFGIPDTFAALCTIVASDRMKLNHLVKLFGKLHVFGRTGGDDALASPSVQVSGVAQGEVAFFRR